MPEPLRRVLTVAPTAPEKVAYALARYSRSPDSITESLEWVRTHDSSKFLDSFYFQYGHASIADLGHLVLCFEGISELAATELEDEQLWDGQARSSRYQDFGKGGFITPPDFDAASAALYCTAGDALLEAYGRMHAQMNAFLQEKLPRPETMKQDAYTRNIAARAYDVARYCLFFGIPTGVGQVVSIRTLERQIRRIRASEYAEVRELGAEAAQACAQPAACGIGEISPEPIAPTLAKYVDPDTGPVLAQENVRQWAEANLPARAADPAESVDLVVPTDRVADIAATLLYSATDRPFRELYALTSSWSQQKAMEVIDAALRSRKGREELLREFRSGTYAFDLLIDIGAWRDFHRHRRCQQFRQAFTTQHGYSVPTLAEQAGLGGEYRAVMDAALAAASTLPSPGRHYILPFATRSRFLFRMDFAEAEYIIRLRSGVKGHFSYREIAWIMKEKLEKAEPELGKLLSGTPPWVEDPLQR